MALAISIALTFYRGFRYQFVEVGVDDGGAFKAVNEVGNIRRVGGTIILRIYGIMSFVNFESVMKKLKKSLKPLDNDEKKVG